jgi:hypothetical protein
MVASIVSQNQVIPPQFDSSFFRCRKVYCTYLRRTLEVLYRSCQKYGAYEKNDVSLCFSVPELEDAKNAKVKFANQLGIRKVVSMKKIRIIVGHVCTAFSTNKCGTEGVCN